MNSESPNTATESPAGGPPVIGRLLREAREARGLTLGDAAQALKLTLRQVDALETDAFQKLPGAAFARGFLRNYAKLVDLDPAALVADFDRVYGAPEVALTPVSNAQGAMPSGNGGPRPTAMPAALVAVGLLAVVVAGWYFDWFQPLPLEAESEPVALESVAPAPQGMAPLVALAPPEAAPPPPLVEPPPATTPAPQGVSGGAEAVPASSQEPAAAPQAPAPDGLDRLVFAFGEDSWVEVRDGSGSIIFSRINKAGTSQEVQGRGPFGLVVGNAKGVTVSHNGQGVDLTPHLKVGVARLTVK